MSEIPYIPWKVTDKLKLEFLKTTQKIGDEITFEGFLTHLPAEIWIKERLWNRLSPIFGDFKVLGLTPFPENGFPVLPVVIPEGMKVKGRVVELQGRVYDFSLFSSLEGRFLAAEKFREKRVEEYIPLEKLGLDGARIQYLFSSTFENKMSQVMLPYFISSSRYLSRVGGCAVDFVDTPSKYYSANMGEIFGMIKNIHPILKKEKFTVELEYGERMEVKFRVPLGIRYSLLPPRNALKFYTQRRGREWEKSAVTKSTHKMEEIIGAADLPFIPKKEETMLYDTEIKEYAVDLALYAFHMHLAKPEVTEELGVKRKILKRIEREFPEIAEAMRSGVLMDMSDVNGFGEHLSRVLNSWRRIDETHALERTMETYMLLFERIDDVFGIRIRRELASLGERRRIERIINRILWELSVLRPEGWSYEMLLSKLEERGLEDKAERIVESLRREGILIENRGLFKAVDTLGSPGKSK